MRGLTGDTTSRADMKGTGIDTGADPE
jgi:hypothetical protein